MDQHRGQQQVDMMMWQTFNVLEVPIDGSAWRHGGHSTCVGGASQWVDVAGDGGSTWQTTESQCGGQQEVDVADNSGSMWWITAGRCSG